MKVKVKPTGHAEIDRQHAFLDELATRFRNVCPGNDTRQCAECVVGERRRCAQALTTLVEGMLSLLAGHANYEEKLMELLPDLPKCRQHIGLHKEAHADIAVRLRTLSARIDSEEPQMVGILLHELVSEWLGEHTSQYDEPLVAEVSGLIAPEIEFDNELVAILDQYVFHGRPTALPSTIRFNETRKQIEARLASLTPRQRHVCRLVVRGLANKQIAKELGTTVNTVKTHRAEIYRKLQVSSLLDLVRVLEKVKN